MWAGRLRQDGNSFTALGPARRAAALKGGSTSQKGKGKSKPSAVAPILPTKGKGVDDPPTADQMVPIEKGSHKGKGKQRELEIDAQGGTVVAVRGSSASSSSVLPSGRADFPTVLPCKRASQDTVLGAGASDEGKSRMLAAFDKDILAASSRTTGCALWNTWCTFHGVWFNDDVPALPLDADKIRKTASCFKEGSYKAYRMYLSKAKELHIIAGHEWSPLLELVSKRAIRSVLRGLGSSRQSLPFNVDKALDVLSQPDVVRLPEGTPVGWANLIVIGTYFVMREMELAFAKVAHVRIDREDRKFTLLLPVSKKDPRAIGCERSWHCLCKNGDGLRRDCPYHAVVSQFDILGKMFGMEQLQSLPLFPDKHGKVANKATVILALEATVRGYGEPTVGANGSRLLGGHSFRVTGAQKLAAAGVEIIKIMVLARWSSEVVLRYVKDAPLVGLSEQVKTLEDKKDLARSLAKASDDADLLGAKIHDIEARLKEITEAQSEWAMRCEASRSSTDSPPYVTNGRTKLLKVHLVSVDGMEHPPYLWRARCGFRFAFCGFTRHSTLVDFDKKTWCGTCIPDTGKSSPVAKLAEAIQDTSSSDSDSGSSSGS